MERADTSANIFGGSGTGESAGCVFECPRLVTASATESGCGDAVVGNHDLKTSLHDDLGLRWVGIGGKVFHEGSDLFSRKFR